MSRSSHSLAALLIQLLAVVGGLAAMIAAPPAHGRMMLLPALGGTASDMARIATRQGARLIGPGRLAGSMVVEGDRRALAGTVLANGVLLVTATGAGCGR